MACQNNIKQKEPLTSNNYAMPYYYNSPQFTLTEQTEGEQVIPNYNQMNFPCHTSSTKYRTVKSLCNTEEDCENYQSIRNMD
jgi:hypothetical protein